MSARCPEGHVSDSTDYCDVCGTPMAAAPAAAPVDGRPSVEAAAPGVAASSAPTQTCPHCGAPNVADALFCEACGYDFTTGTPPMDAVPPEPAAAEPAESDEPEPDAPEPEEPEPDAPEPEDDDADAGDAEAGDAEADEEPVADLPAPVAEEVAEQPAPAEAAPADPAPTAHPRARHTPPSRALAEAWVVELWVDPDWYAVQQTAEDCPSAGVPDVVLLTRSTALVGRPSGSLGVRPEIDVGADSAVSRRHAQLTSDGQRWWVEDLGSSNGTFVGTVGEPLPTRPLTPGQRVEIDRDDRLYVGAWTRIVLRQATKSESEGLG